MKKSNRILSLILSIVLILGMLPTTTLATENSNNSQAEQSFAQCSAQETTSATSGKCGQSATWSFDSDSGTLTIAGSGRMADYDHEWFSPVDDDYSTAAPWVGLRDQIKKVSIGNKITYIGEESFSGGPYNNAKYPNLETIVFESGSSVTEIGRYAFMDADSVKTITLPASLETLGFDALPSLSAVYVESGNKTFYSDNGVLYQGKTLVYYPTQKDNSSYAVLEGTKKITSSSFIVV